MRYALINMATGNVDNVIEVDPDWPPPEGYEIILSDEASPGWSYIDGVFAPPPPPILTPAQILAANTQQQINLFYASPAALMALLMATDFGTSTDANIVKARAWQSYYKDVLAIDLTLANPPWPSVPS